MNFRLPFTLQRGDGLAVARFDFYPSEPDTDISRCLYGVLISQQVGEVRESFFVGANRALDYARGLLGDGWYLIGEGRR
jgi:hypothetical protein